MNAFTFPMDQIFFTIEIGEIAPKTGEIGRRGEERFVDDRYRGIRGISSEKSGFAHGGGIVGGGNWYVDVTVVEFTCARLEINPHCVKL